jgi:dolichyl-phosphate beta-glucosyltransferase
MNVDPQLTIVIPAYNEVERLGSTLDELRRYVERTPTQVVVVDDGSTDGTYDLVERASREDGRFVGVRHDVNRGKGAAVRDGLLRADGGVVAFMDADLAYGLAPLAEVMRRIEDGADMVVGARDLLETDSRGRYTPVRRAATATFSTLVRWVVPLDVPDTQCGFKAMRRPVARHMARVMTVDGFAFDIEMLLVARLWRLRIDRIPVEMSRSRGSTVRLLADSLRMGRDLVAVRTRSLRGGYPPRPAEL